MRKCVKCGKVMVSDFPHFTHFLIVYHLQMYKLNPDLLNSYPQYSIKITTL